MAAKKANKSPSKSKYRARKQGSFSDKDAQIVGKFFEKHFPDGSPEPKIIVQLAKDEKCPLHKYFDWDVKKAAKKWWLLQARQLVGMVYIEIEPDVEIRGWESVVVEGKRQYQDSETVTQHEDLIDQVIQAALRQLELWERKYKTYKSLKNLVATVAGIRVKEEKSLKKRSKKS